MEKTDRKEFAEVIVAIAEAFNRPVSEGMLEVYWQSLRDLGLEEFKAAAFRAVKESQFFPTVHAIRVRCEDNPELCAARQWEYVIGSFRGTPDEEPDGLAEKAVKLMGGWQVLGDRPPGENDTWSRKEFLRLYVLLAEKGDPEDARIGSGNREAQGMIDGLADHMGLPE